MFAVRQSHCYHPFVPMCQGHRLTTLQLTGMRVCFREHPEWWTSLPNLHTLAAAIIDCDGFDMRGLSCLRSVTATRSLQPLNSLHELQLTALDLLLGHWMEGAPTEIDVAQVRDCNLPLTSLRCYFNESHDGDTLLGYLASMPLQHLCIHNAAPCAYRSVDFSGFGVRTLSAMPLTSLELRDIGLTANSDIEFPHLRSLKLAGCLFPYQRIKLPSLTDLEDEHFSLIPSPTSAWDPSLWFHKHTRVRRLALSVTQQGIAKLNIISSLCPGLQSLELRIVHEWPPAPTSIDQIIGGLTKLRDAGVPVTSIQLQALDRVGLTDRKHEWVDVARAIVCASLATLMTIVLPDDVNPELWSELKASHFANCGRELTILIMQSVGCCETPHIESTEECKQRSHKFQLDRLDADYYHLRQGLLEHALREQHINRYYEHLEFSCHVTQCQ